MVRFDVAAARKEGYGDEEIADFLAQQSGYDLKGAFAEGYTPKDVIDFLTTDQRGILERVKDVYVSKKGGGTPAPDAQDEFGMVRGDAMRQPSESPVAPAEKSGLARAAAGIGLADNVAEASKAGVYKAGAGLLDSFWMLAQSAESPKFLGSMQGPMVGLAQAARALMPKDENGRAKRTQLAAQLDDAAEAFAPEIAKESFDDAWDKGHVLPWMVVQAANQSPQIGAMMATILVPSLAPVALPLMGVQAAGNQYAENVKAGVAQERAALDAAVNGFVEMASEYMGAGIAWKAGELFKRVHSAIPAPLREAAATSILARIAAAGGTITAAAGLEGATEAAGQVVQDISQKNIAGRDPGDMAANARTAFFASLLPGAMFATPHTVAQAARPMVQPAPPSASTIALTDDVQGDIEKILAAPITEPTIPAGPAATAVPVAPTPADADLGLAGPSPTAMPAEVPDARAVENTPVEPTPDAITGGAAAPASAAAPAGIQPAAVPLNAQPEGAVPAQAPEAIAPGVAPAPIPPSGATAQAERKPADMQAGAPEAKPESEDFQTRRGEVKAFKSEKQAAMYARQATNRVPGNFKPRQTEEGEWVLSRQLRDRTPAQRANDARLKKERTTVDAARDSLATVMGKLGGLSLEELKRDGFDPPDAKLIRSGIFGRPAIRAKGGISLDAMAELVSQHGFDVFDENGHVDAHKMRELVDASLDGPVYTPEGYEHYASKADEERDQRARADAMPDEATVEASGYNEAEADERAAIEALMDEGLADHVDDTDIDLDGGQAVAADDELFGEEAPRARDTRPAPEGEARPGGSDREEAPSAEGGVDAAPASSDVPHADRRAGSAGDNLPQRGAEAARANADQRALAQGARQHDDGERVLARGEHGRDDAARAGAAPIAGKGADRGARRDETVDRGERPGGAAGVASPQRETPPSGGVSTSGTRRLTNPDALKGKRVEVTLTVEGKEAKLRVDADRIKNLMDERVANMKRVLACLRG